MDIVDKLTEIFKDFPGIGERQARRFVYFLMSRNKEYTTRLVAGIEELKGQIRECKSCFRFFLNQGESVCKTCKNPNNDASSILVVEKDTDLESIEKSRTYHGKYFVLGGLVPIVEKNTKKMVRIEELKKRLEEDKNIKEVILAFSLSPQGDHTDSYVRQELEDIAQKTMLKISSLGRGLSTGTELEYSDNETLKNALKNRQ